MHYKKVIVYTFCRPILASVDNCNWIFIAQLYRVANESNSIYILSTYFASVDNCIRISVAQLYRIANESNSIYILSTHSCKC